MPMYVRMSIKGGASLLLFADCRCIRNNRRERMAKNQEGISLIPTRFQHPEIPISVATLIIDGKRLTSAFYKQITEADLIAENTGELRGDPIGYFHLHSKACPEVQHTHVLWATETELHLA